MSGPWLAAVSVVTVAALLMPACSSAGTAGDANTVAMIPNYQGGGQTEQPRADGLHGAAERDHGRPR